MCLDYNFFLRSLEYSNYITLYYCHNSVNNIITILTYLYYIRKYIII